MAPFRDGLDRAQAVAIISIPFTAWRARALAAVETASAILHRRLRLDRAQAVVWPITTASSSKVHGLSRLNVIGFGDRFTNTYSYDAAEYFAPADDMPEYDDDNNEYH
jgi:hypothetical protein